MSDLAPLGVTGALLMLAVVLAIAGGYEGVVGAIVGSVMTYWLPVRRARNDRAPTKGEPDG